MSAEKAINKNKGEKEKESIKLVDPIFFDKKGQSQKKNKIITKGITKYKKKSKKKITGKYNLNNINSINDLNYENFLILMKIAISMAIKN